MRNASATLRGWSDIDNTMTLVGIWRRCISASTSKPERPSSCRSSISTSGASRLTSDKACVMSSLSPMIECPAACSNALSPARTIGWSSTR